MSYDQWIGPQDPLTFVSGEHWEEGPLLHQFHVTLIPQERPKIFQAELILSPVLHDNPFRLRATRQGKTLYEGALIERAQDRSLMLCQAVKWQLMDHGDLLCEGVLHAKMAPSFFVCDYSQRHRTQFFSSEGISLGDNFEPFPVGFVCCAQQNLLLLCQSYACVVLFDGQINVYFYVPEYTADGRQILVSCGGQTEALPYNDLPTKTVLAQLESTLYDIAGGAYSIKINGDNATQEQKFSVLLTHQSTERNPL